MKLAIAGSGYVGLVTGTCFAELGNDVTCVDIDEAKIQKLNDDVMPIYEPGLKEMVIRNKKESRLKFTTDLKSAVKSSEIIFICVGTPSRPDGSLELDNDRVVAFAGIRLSEGAMRILPILLADRQVELELEASLSLESPENIILAYVFVQTRELQFPFKESDKPRVKRVMVNQSLLEMGAASVSETSSFKMKNHFIEIQNKAKKDGQGIWSYVISA